MKNAFPYRDGQYNKEGLLDLSSTEAKDLLLTQKIIIMLVGITAFAGLVVSGSVSPACN